VVVAVVALLVLLVVLAAVEWVIITHQVERVRVDKALLVVVEQAQTQVVVAAAVPVRLVQLLLQQLVLMVAQVHQTHILALP
jgi:hypothetical protein